MRIEAVVKFGKHKRFPFQVSIIQSIMLEAPNILPDLGHHIPTQLKWNVTWDAILFGGLNLV